MRMFEFRIDQAAVCTLLSFLVAALFSGATWADEQGLVAHYVFDEGSGTTLKDRSGNGNDGTIHGAEWTRLGEGSCLWFDGVDDFVDCGNTPTLDLKGAVTLEAWAFPAVSVAGEPGIAGKHFSSFLLTYFRNGKLYWYIHEGSNSCQAVLSPGSWHHLAGTFDGAAMRLYVDGTAVDSRTSKHATIGGTGPFIIGAAMGDPGASDPNVRAKSFFSGKIAEVRVYDRCLSADEVRAQYDLGFPRFGLGGFNPIASGETARSQGVSVTGSPDGRIGIATEKGRYVMESAYSAPGERTQWNAFPLSASSADQMWTPQVRSLAGDKLEIEARATAYDLRRTVKAKDDRIEFEDSITNTGLEPVGVLIEHRLIAPEAFQETISPGNVEVPLIFARSKTDSLGVLVEDDVGRRKFEARLGLPLNEVKFGLGDLAVGAGQTYTMRWTIHLLPANADYFDLVNRVRRNWNSITTIEGPMDCFDIGRLAGLLADPDALKAYFQRKRQRLVLVAPWLDYDPATFDHVWPRDEYKQRVQEAARLIRQANPEAKVLGCIETDWVTINPAEIPAGDTLPNAESGTGRVRLTPAQTKVIDQSGTPFLDSVRRDADGNVMLELYRRGGKSQTALAVFPSVGNHQYEFLMGQVKFLIDEVGLDGFYIDEFNQAFHNDLRTYDGWDGCSAEIDLRTGKIARKYVDCSVAGIAARVNLCQYALQRGKSVVANTYASSSAEQVLAVNRFSETQGSLNPFAVEDGQEPPLVIDILKGNLATPIGLGIMQQPGKTDTAKTIMKTVVAYLRHGALYYHYAIEDIPETGEGSGEYGPINHMFPITPLELHKGWIIGKERIITCVSGDYAWPLPARPGTRLFDLHGREVQHEFPVTQTGDGWRVSVRLSDWAQIAVIE